MTSDPLIRLAPDDANVALISVLISPVCRDIEADNSIKQEEEMSS